MSARFTAIPAVIASAASAAAALTFAPGSAPAVAPGAAPPAAEVAGAPLRVVSFNIRYDTPKDGQQSWRFRNDRLVEHVASLDADFIGFQEVLPSQRADLVAGLPAHGSIGRSRERSPAEGEATPIFYHRGRWAPIESRSGTFWLSESPGEPGSRSWRSACPRIATWGVFRELATGRRILVLNTHLDHESQEAREQGAAVIAKFLAGEARDLPVIVMGDFNAAATNPARRTLCEGVDGSPPLTDTFAALHPGVDRNSGTFHGFRGGAAGPRIDAILVSDAFEIIAAGIDRTGDDGAYLSDHWAVTAELRLRRTDRPIGSGSKEASTTPVNETTKDGAARGSGADEGAHGEKPGAGAGTPDAGADRPGAGKPGAGGSPPADAPPQDPEPGSR